MDDCITHFLVPSIQNALYFQERSLLRSEKEKENIHDDRREMVCNKNEPRARKPLFEKPGKD